MISKEVFCKAIQLIQEQKKTNEEVSATLITKH